MRSRSSGAIRRIERAVHTTAGAERKGRISPARADALASLLGTAHTRAQGLLTGR
jgi:hypothetical protein